MFATHISRIGTALATVVLALLAGTGTAAAGDYKLYDTDGLSVKSGDGKAQAFGQIKWFHGAFPRGYRHRGDYTPKAKIRAIKPVGCIWVKVSYGYPNGSFDVGSGGAGGSVSGGQYDATRGFFVNCRRSGHRRPTQLSLYGVGYAKALLNSSTLQVCTSSAKKRGPLFCSFEKNTYGD